MRPARWSTLLFLLLAAAGVVALVRHVHRPSMVVLPAAPMQQEPLTMLWAWETPEDLTALDPARTGVAFLARELLLSGATPNAVVVRPRRQPLQLAPHTWLLAVVRLDALHTPPDTAALRQQLLDAILPATALPDVRGLQIDFDATAAQRPLYAHLLHDLRAQMPLQMPLSITALASWCGPQSWLPPLAGTVDEAVPMFFRMGGTASLRASLPKDTAHLTQPLCATSMGVATDETWPALHSRQRVYIFRSGPWTLDDLQRLNRAGPTALSHPRDAP